jgi:hypothetical protein
MTEYSIVAARPKNASNHLKSQFKLYELNKKNESDLVDWKSIGEVNDLMRAGHEVRTGKIIDEILDTGAAVEIELRITKNDTNYKISNMPDA